MKAYTDLEQSKKLAEILPLESADMGWNVFVDGTTRILPIDDWDLVKDGSGNVEFYPAWSLAALLKLIPSYIIQREAYFGTLELHECCLKYQTNDGVDLFETKNYDDYIDAAFEMVVWLKENNKL